MLLVPIMLASLGKDGYGVWALLAYGLAYPIILERAFALAINRFVAYYREDVADLNRFISASFLILSGLAVITTVAAVALSFFVADIFAAIPADLAFESQITCILVGVTLALNMLQSTFGGALRGYEYYTRCNGVMIFYNVLRGVLTVALLLLWKSIIAPQVAFVVSAALSAILMFWVAFKSIPGLRVSPKLVDRATARELWHYTSHSMARSGSTIIMYNTLTLLVGWKGTAADVTTYDIAIKFPNLIRSLLGGVQNVFLPVVTSFHACGQLQKVKSLVKRATKMCVVITLIVIILLFVLTEDLLALWLRGDVSKELVMVMRVLLISAMPDGLFGVWLPTLVGLGHLRALTISSILGSAVAIVGALFLLQGPIAVPLAPSIAMLIVLWVYRGLWLPMYGVRKIDVRLHEYFSESLFKPLVSCVISIIILMAFDMSVVWDSFPWVLRATLYATVVVICFAVISLRREFKEFVCIMKRRFSLRQD